MGFERFYAARDALYLAALLAGLVLGCVCRICGFRTVPARRKRLITAGLCLLSAAVAALASALVFAGDSPWSLKPLVLPCCGAAGIAALAFLFPRAVAVPLVLLGGLFTVWLGYSFLRFPPFPLEETPAAAVSNRGAGVFALDAPGYEKIRIQDNGQPLDFFAASVRYGERFPLIGGIARGGLSAIRRGETLLIPAGGAAFFERHYARFPPEPGPWAVSCRRYEARLDPAAIPPGMVKTLFLAENSEAAGLIFH